MKNILTISLTSLLLAGCSMTPDYTRPDLQTPALWSEAQQSKAPAIIAYDWWSAFSNAELNTLMIRALENNTDLLAGVQRIEQARASLKIAGADLLPEISGSGGASRSRTNPISAQATGSSSLNAGLSASYELDLFGANRASVEGAKAIYQGSLYDQEALKLTLIGDVATGYFTLVNLRERLKIADNNLENARAVLRIIQARVDAGAESDLELAQQKSSVALNETARVTLAEQIKNAENALAILLGVPPQSLEIPGDTLQGVDVPSIAAGQPSELLERRPDLLSAEAGLRAANADIGAARAAFYPSISLGLSDSISLAGFGEPSTTVLSLASAISAPIFQGGSLEGGLDQANARQLELVQTYYGAVLSAFQDVEDAMVAVKAAQLREEALAVAMNQARRAYSLSKNRYDAGSIDFQTLLDTQNAQLSAEDSYAQARLARLSAAVSLYRALGGGWTSQ